MMNTQCTLHFPFPFLLRAHSPSRILSPALHRSLSHPRILVRAEDPTASLDKTSFFREDTPLEFAQVVKTVEKPWWQNWLGGLASVGVVLFLMMLHPPWVDARRSGGRMGGSTFNTYRSTASSARWGYQPTAIRSRPSTQINSFFFPSYGYGVGMGANPFFTLAIYAFLAYTLFSVVRGAMNGDQMDGGFGYEDEEVISERSSVCKVQVGLLGLARGLQRDLDTLARRSDTTSSTGLHYLLQETLLALNRNPDYCVYGGAEVKRARNVERAESGFNAMSMQERGKFREETLSNWSGQRQEKQATLAKSGVANELIVVTILIATVGTLQVPTVRSREDLKIALNRLGSVRAKDLLALEVLWTPQDENDSFTPDELLADYPELCTL